MTPSISIVIVNWNSGLCLTNCLKSVFSTTAGVKLEVWVIDNGSSDDSLTIASDSFPQARIIRTNQNLGFAKACNIGWKEANGEYVMFLNPDAALRTGTIDGIIGILQKDPEIGAVGCRIVGDDGTVWPLLMQRFSTPWLQFIRLFVAPKRLFGGRGGEGYTGRADQSGLVVKLSGACLTVRRSVLELIGGFDERYFMYCEDGDLCRSIVESKFLLFYTADFEVTHVQGSCSKKAPSGFTILMQCESFQKYMKKHHGVRGAIQYRILMLIGACIRLLVSLAGLIVMGAFSSKKRALWFGRVNKNWILLGWSCGILQPTIPQ